MVDLGLPLGASGAPDQGGASAPGQEWDKHTHWLPEALRDRDLHDSYILGELLGRSSTASVYKCLYKGKTECACKVINKSVLNRRRIECELVDMMALKHPNLVLMRDVLETTETVSLIMELVRGGELLERIAERGYYSELTAAWVLRQLLSAVQCLHSAGFAHGALRPEKLHFSSEAEEAPIKVLCVWLGEQRMHASALPFCAPELTRSRSSRGQEASPAADMWSVGVITYIMLSGLEPFMLDEEGASASASDPERLRFPSPWWDDVSDSARDLVAQLLQADPRARPTAEQALLHPWIRGDTVRTKHMDTTVQSIREFNARRKFRAATQAVVATQRLVSPEKRLSRVLAQAPLQGDATLAVTSASATNSGPGPR